MTERGRTAGDPAAPAQLADHQLVAAARDGDRDALDALLRRHYPRLRALCLRLTGDQSDADDACQEALVALARGLGRFDGRSAFATWAYRVTTNTCLDELRRRRRRPRPGLPDDDALSETAERGTDAGRPPPTVPDTGDRVAARVDLDAAIAGLAPDFRVAVVLRDLCELSYREIADVLDVPVGTVRSRIARGRAALLPVVSGNHTADGERRTP